MNPRSVSVCYLRLSVFRVTESLLGCVCVLRLLALAVCTDAVHQAGGARGVRVVTAVHLNTQHEGRITLRPGGAKPQVTQQPLQEKLD